MGLCYNKGGYWALGEVCTLLRAILVIGNTLSASEPLRWRAEPAGLLWLRCQRDPSVFGEQGH